jgi:hypothetical protein
MAAETTALIPKTSGDILPAPIPPTSERSRRDPVVQDINGLTVITSPTGEVLINGVRITDVADFMAQRTQLNLDEKEHDSGHRFMAKTMELLRKMDPTIDAKAAKEADPGMYIAGRAQQLESTINQLQLDHQASRTRISEQNANQKTALILADMAKSRWMWTKSPKELQAVAVEYWRQRSLIINATLAASITSEELTRSTNAIVQLAEAHATASTAKSKAELQVAIKREENRHTSEDNKILELSERQKHVRTDREENLRIIRENVKGYAEDTRESASKWLDMIGEKAKRAWGAVVSDNGLIKKFADGSATWFEKWKPQVDQVKLATGLMGIATGFWLGTEAAWMVYGDTSVVATSPEAKWIVIPVTIATGLLGYMLPDGAATILSKFNNKKP